MKFKSLLSLAVAAMLIPAMPLMAHSKTYNMAVGDPEDSEQGYAATAFKKYVEEKTNGQTKIEVFFGSALGDESESFRNVQKGTLPYLWKDLDEVVAGTTGKPAELLNSYAIKAGFRILTFTYCDFRFITNSRKPITKMADMKGLKFRVPQSAVLIASYKAFGGSPTPISWSETFTALQQGVVDGQCYGYIGFQAMKFLEANQKYLTEVHYTYQIQPIVVSERVFRKMSPEEQALMIEAGKYAQDQVLQYQKNDGSKAKEALIAAGLTVSTLEDEDQWMKAAYEKVWPEMADFVGGKEAINEYLRALGKPEWNN